MPIRGHGSHGPIPFTQIHTRSLFQELSILENIPNEEKDEEVHRRIDGVFAEAVTVGSHTGSEAEGVRSALLDVLKYAHSQTVRSGAVEACIRIATETGFPETARHVVTALGSLLGAGANSETEVKRAIIAIAEAQPEAWFARDGLNRAFRQAAEANHGTGNAISAVNNAVYASVGRSRLLELTND